MPAVKWIPDNVVIPAEFETPGLFDLDMFPHVRGVLEGVDDPAVREIYMQWGARNAKTTTAIAALLYFAVNIPRPMVFGSSTEEKADDTIQSQIYPMLEGCQATAKQLRPAHARNKSYVALDRCRIRKSWSGSPSSMAGFPACYGHAGEVSKWSQSKSLEGDPVRLFTKRALLYSLEKKFFFESTPGTKGFCRINELLENTGTDRRTRWVPCPHCKKYQRLKFGNGVNGTGGLRWEKGPTGHSERSLAVSSAWYECEHCRGRIEDHHRPSMMRKGVWLSEGQEVDQRGKIHGRPRVPSENVGFGPLSALYSLAISGWGQIVGEFLDSRHSIEARRDFVNSVLGEVWDPAPVKIRVETLGSRLCSPDNEARGWCPAWSVFATGAIDVQEGGDLFEWQVCTWGPGARGHVVDYGQVFSFDDLKKLITTLELPHLDRGNPLRPARWLIDARDGHVTERVYTFCGQVPGVLPCMGSRHSAFPEFCRLQPLDNNPTWRKAASAVLIPTQFSISPLYVEINGERTQSWVEELIGGQLLPGVLPALTINAEAATDLVWLDQIVAERADAEVNNAGYSVRVWKKTGKNEQRDTLRYNRALAELLTRHGQSWPHLIRHPPGWQPPRPAEVSRFTTPDGRPFLVTER